MYFTPKYLIILLISICIINSICSKNIFLWTKELFSNNDSLSLKSLNACGRNLVFPSDTTSNALASTRASKSDIGVTDPRGVCGNTSGIPSDYDTSKSVVVENGLYYSLKSVCMGLRFVGYQIDINKNLWITFMNDSISDRDNLSFLLLLNPLYVEFISRGGKITMGYKLVLSENDLSGNSKTFVYSPGENVKNITFQFTPIIDPDKTNCDTTFDYKTMGIDMLKDNDLKNMNVINLNVYYLDDIPTSFQKSSRSINLNYDLSGSQLGTSTIYWNDYSNDTSPLRKKPLSLNEKLFMNNIRIMYSNYIIPTMTFSFDINVQNSLIETLKKNSLSFLMCYVDNGDEWLSCGANNTSGGKNNNNIFSLSIGYKDNDFFLLTITTSKSKPPDCNFNVMDPDCLNLAIPYNGNNDNTRLIFTISPGQKNVYAQFFKKGKKLFSLGKKVNCPYTDRDICNNNIENSNINTLSNYVNIFANKQRPVGNMLGNIILAYNKQIVKGINTVQLGYQNFYKFNQND